jgi:hypothetical protein
LAAASCQPERISPPIAQHRGFRDIEQRRNRGNVQTAKEPPLHHGSLTRVQLRQRLECRVELEELLLPRRAHFHLQRKRYRHVRGRAAALVCQAPACRLDQKLAHGPRCNPLEVKFRTHREFR